MRPLIKSFVTASLLSLCAWLVPIPAMAQAYPSRPVTLINPYPPGGVVAHRDDQVHLRRARRSKHIPTFAA